MLVEISKFVGAVMVTLAVKPDPWIPNETGEEENTPSHEVNEALGEEIVSSANISVYGV